MLVIKVGQDDPLNSLHGVLGREHGVVLASAEPGYVDEGRSRVAVNPDIGVAVVIGSEVAIPSLDHMSA